MASDHPPDPASAIAAPPAGALARQSDVAAARIRQFLESARAPATRRAYEHHWRSWQGWCRQRGVVACPAEPREIVVWIEAVSGANGWSLAKVEGVAAAIAHVHRLKGIDPPPTSHTFVKAALSAFRRLRGRAPKGAKAAIVQDALGALLAQIDRSTVAGKRDAALLLVTWWSACRRSEVVALTAADVLPAPGGLALRIVRSKTDAEGRGELVGLERKGGPLCPVAALEAWLAASGIAEGPVFRGFTGRGQLRRTALSAGEVGLLVKRLATLAGLDAAKLGGHSLRAGHITEAILQDVPAAQIMAQTRHRNATTLQRYYREADPVRRGSTARIKIRESKP